MNNPLFSIIIPAYNAEKYIGECLDSLIVQSFGDFEVIVIDDGSEDKTSEVVRNYCNKDERIRFIRKSNGGVSSARNKGIDEAKGEWLTFLDADDLFVEDALTCIEKSIVGYENIDIVIWGWRTFGTNKPDIEYKYQSLSELETCKTIKKGLFYVCPYLGYSCIKAFKRCNIGKLRFHEDIKYNEDRLFVFEYLTNLKRDVYCANLKEILYLYRQHDGQAMSRFKGVVTKDLLTDLEAFRRMALIAQQNGDKNLLRVIIKSAWGNIRMMRRHVNGADESVKSRLNELSYILLSMIPFYMLIYWYLSLGIGKVFRIMSRK